MPVRKSRIRKSVGLMVAALILPVALAACTPDQIAAVKALDVSQHQAVGVPLHHPKSPPEACDYKCVWFKTVAWNNAANPHGSYPIISWGGHLCYGSCIWGSKPCALPSYHGTDVCMRESQYIINVREGSGASNASGKYQFLGSTWAWFHGYPEAGVAPEKDQDERAVQLYDGGRGCGHWGIC